MKDVEVLRSEVITRLYDVQDMLPKGDDDQIIPDDIQESMKDKLQEILNLVD